MGNWSGSNNENELHWSQDTADASLYRDDGKWWLSRSMDIDDEWRHQELGDMSIDEAVKQAEEILWTEFFDYHELATQTVELRAEVNEAYVAWQADVQSEGLERDYFDKLDRLDHNLAERGLERGEDINEEIPLREQENPMSPSHGWDARDDGTAYHWSDNNGVDVWVTKEHRNRWQMTYTLDHDSPTFHADLGKTRQVHTALDRAELVIEDAHQQVDQTYQDMQTLVNLANEVDDRTPQEQAAIDRVTEVIQEHPLQRSLNRSIDRSLGRDGRER
jgi:hypothetical protein